MANVAKFKAEREEKPTLRIRVESMERLGFWTKKYATHLIIKAIELKTYTR